MSENSRNHHKQAIKSFTLWLLDEERIETYPLRKLKKRKVRQQRYRRDGLRADEMETFVAITAKCRLPTKLLPGLRKWLRGRSGHMFPALKIKRVCKMVRLDLLEAGLPVDTPDGRRTFHSLRNAFITRLFELKVPAPSVQKAARHGTME